MTLWNRLRGWWMRMIHGNAGGSRSNQMRRTSFLTAAACGTGIAMPVMVRCYDCED